jgi:hypothetical protein
MPKLKSRYHPLVAILVFSSFFGVSASRLTRRHVADREMPFCSEPEGFKLAVRSLQTSSAK